MTETALEAPALEIEVQVPLSEPPVNDGSDKKKNETLAAAPKKKEPFNLVTAIARAPANVDGFVQHLHRCLHTRSGTDTVLLFVAYTARLTGASLDILGRTALRHSASKLIQLAFQAPPTGSVDLASVPVPPLASLAIAIAKRLEALVGMLGEWRTMNRLWGIMAMWLAAKDLLLRLRKPADESGDKPAEESSKFNTTVEVLQIASLIVYHIGEATAWFTAKGVLPFSPEVRDRSGLVSARSWGAYVFIELFRLLVERQRRTVSQDAAAEKAYKDDWFTKFTHSLAWAPLTIHWGFGSGFLPEVAVGALAFYPSAALMKDLWKSTA